MRTVPLSQGYVALVDDADFDSVMQFKWHVKIGRTMIYASRNTKQRRTEQMHNFIMGRLKIDHHDGNGLNNQRHNLRPATSSQNLANARKRINKSKTKCRSIWKGVSRNKYSWVAQIRINGKLKHLGCFDKEWNAAQAYNFAAEELFGEFARFNVSTRQEGEFVC